MGAMRPSKQTPRWGAAFETHSSLRNNPATKLSSYPRHPVKRLHLSSIFMHHRILCLNLFLLLICGCQGQSTQSRQYFDIAEDAYKSGQYEVAHQNYTTFLRLNPDPQLARLAERRILSIEREMECVLGQKEGPRPAYVNHDETGETPSQHPRIISKD